MQLVTRAALGIALSTAATASAQPACPAGAVDQTAASVCAAEAAVHDAQVSLDQAQAMLATAQGQLAPPAYVAWVPPPPVVVGPPSGPRAGSLAFEVALPTDFTFAPHQTLIGAAGVAFGLGYRLTRSVELGWTVDLEDLVSTAIDANDPYLRIRSGVETRYLFGASSPHPGARVVFTPWLGARAGFELLDAEATTRGEYADVSAGVDWWVHRHQFGMYVSLGMSVEPATAYATVTTTALTSQPTSAPAAPTVASPYVAIAWRWGFW
jgi:hypothetical protein